MKKLILSLSLALLCLSLTTKAQVTALGKSEYQIKHYNEDNDPKSTLIKRGVLDNGNVTLYYDNPDHTSSGYILTNDTCVRYTLIYKVSGLAQFISQLTNWTKTNDSEWVDKTYNYRLTVTTSDDSFFANFEKL